MDFEYQYDLLSKGTVEIIKEEEFKVRLKKSIATKTPLRVKLGCDPSRPDIHLGHTVQLNKLRQFQELGHQIVFIIGDFTGMIGDPSGKDTTRPMLTEEAIKENAKTYFDQVGKILDIEKAEVEYNSRWLTPMNFVDVIKLASNYTVARMMERDDFEKRYKAEKPISVQEFLYPLAQAYDSVVVKADIELGGTDQKFNFILTRDIQKAYGQVPEIVITNPLLVGLDGIEKMSKSLDNYIAITDCPKDIFGKIMSISDDLMYNYYELLTDLTLPEIKKMKNEIENNEIHPMNVKKDLAMIITERFFDKAAAKNARDEFESVFSKGNLPEEMKEHRLTESELTGGKIWIVKLVTDIGFAKSNGEARRLVTQNAVSIDGEKISDVQVEIEAKDGMVIKVGKKNFAKLVL
ncbi:MAG: tyrosine--tRNA ligase [Pseudomonadota bacterium]